MIFYYNQIDFKKRINKLKLYTPFFSCEHPLGVDILIIYLDSYIVVGKKVKEKEEMVTVNLGMLHYLLDHIYGALMHRSRISTPFYYRGVGRHESRDAGEDDWGATWQGSRSCLNACKKNRVNFFSFISY